MAKRSSVPFYALCAALLGAALLAAGCGSTLTPLQRAATKDPATVAVFAEQTLTLPAFEAQYARSVGGRTAAQDDSLGAYQDFLERYVNFRLKVIEGLHAGYDRDPAILQEINGYRASFAKPYLLDKSVVNPIIADLYERSREMVDVSHILLRVGPDAPPADTLAAYNEMIALRDSARQGVDFGDLAFRHSQDPSAQRAAPGDPGHRGRLGFFTAGRMVEPFERMAYRTPAGEVSPVFRTQFGYHLLYVHDRQPAVPEVRVSHLMLRPEGATAADSAKTLEDLQALKRRLEAGESFSDLAREYSVDKVSAERGGDLGFLRYDNTQILKVFREAAFGLDSLNTVSDVLITPYGYHLLTITERKERGTLDDEYESLKQMASKLPRTREAELQLAADLRTQYAARVDSTTLLDAVAPVPFDSLMIVLGGAHLPDSVLARPFASLGDSTYTLRRLTAFVADHRIQRMDSKDQQLWKTVDTFLDQSALAYEAAQLEARDDEFRAIMDEFRDGLILFRLMEDSVWSAAAQDSAALAAYFEAHRDAYQFPERTRIVEVYSRSDSLLQAVAARLDEGLGLDALAAEWAQDTTGTVSLDTMLVAGKTNSVFDYALPLDEGAHTTLIPYRQGYVVLVRQGQVPARPKTLDEARTEVVNDYQQVLEDRLVERLRRKYHVLTFPERLARAFTEPPAEAATTTAAASQ